MPLIEVPQPPFRPGENNALAAPLASVAGEVTAENRIGIDVPCRRCGYNLRGLHVEAKCPECALPAWPSLRPGLVGFGEPRFVEFLRWGALALAGGLALVLAGAVIAMGRGAFRDLPRLCGVAASLVGSWMLTTPDPSGVGEAGTGPLRKATRVLLIVGVFFLPLRTLRDMVATAPTATELLGMFIFIADVAAIVAAFALLRYLRRLAFRMFEPVLAMQIDWTAYQSLACAAAIFVTSAGFTAAVTAFKPTAGNFLRAARPFVLVVAVVTIGQIALACWRLANELAAHARLARKSWPENDAACADAGGAADEPPTP